MSRKPDFSGWATKTNLRCGDGRTIMQGAFDDNDKKRVPLVWQHNHSDVAQVLGHAILEKRPEGMFAYGFFNGTPNGMNAKECLHNGDVECLSICANQLKEDGNGNVFHGNIRELSLCLAGANPGATIENVIEHADGTAEEAQIWTGEGLIVPEETINHADDEDDKKEDKDVADKKDKTVVEVIDSMTDEQRTVMEGLIGAAIDEVKNSKSEEDKEMSHSTFSVFGNDNGNGNDNATLTHDMEMTIIGDGKRYGSLKDSFLEHAGEYGIQDIDWLFPEYKNVEGTGAPTFLRNEPSEWVNLVLGGVHHTPFARIKSLYADIREDEARAKGYIKGNLKKEEVFSLLKRSTDPQTIYKKQKFDRDDVVDITDFDVVGWVKGEMRLMLDEELARAILVGDGRLASDDDKISADHIRPIMSDATLFTIQKTITVASGEETAHAIINGAIRARKDYRGSGTPILFTSEDWLTEMLLLEDADGRPLYDDEAKLARKLRVSKIVTFPYLPETSYGLIVNLADYNVGADKGGSVSMFDDFDIDYNQQKYLIETRCSGALIKPFSAINLVVDQDTQG